MRKHFEVSYVERENIERYGSFTVDAALKKDGTWTCIEIGDGQVSALPDRGNAEEFYKELLND